MGFSEGKLCADSFIHVMFLKRMSKIVLVSTLILLLFFYLFFIPVHVGLYLICPYQWATIYVNFIIEMDLFSFHLITTFSFWSYILVFAVLLGWQYMFFFSSGQSNPTFCLSKNGKKFVLRKKPPGKLLRGAHQVCLDRTLYLCSLIA